MSKEPKCRSLVHLIQGVWSLFHPGDMFELAHFYIPNARRLFARSYYLYSEFEFLSHLLQVFLCNSFVGCFVFFFFFLYVSFIWVCILEPCFRKFLVSDNMEVLRDVKLVEMSGCSYQSIGLFVFSLSIILLYIEFYLINNKEADFLFKKQKE